MVIFNVVKKTVKYTILGVITLIVLFLLLIYTLVFISGVEYYMKPKQDNTPVVLNKNEQGEYRMVVRLGEDARTLIQRNPNLFVSREYDGYPVGFLRPRFSSKEIPNVRLELLDEDYELALSLNGFETDIMLASEKEPLNAGFLSAHLKETGNIHRAVKASEAFSDTVEEIQNATHLSNEEKTKQIDAITQTFEEQEKQYEIETSKKLYQQYQDILAVLKKYNWKPDLYPYSPRIFGQESWVLQGDYKYGHLINRDGFYIDSYEKWQKYVEDDNIFVCFYRKNLLLRLSVSDLSPRLEIETNTSHYLNREDDRWMEKLAADIPKWQAERKEAEDILRAKGYTIDESYVDAPLPKEFLEWQQAKQSNSK